MQLTDSQTRLNPPPHILQCCHCTLWQLTLNVIKPIQLLLRLLAKHTHLINSRISLNLSNYWHQVSDINVEKQTCWQRHLHHISRTLLHRSQVCSRWQHFSARNDCHLEILSHIRIPTLSIDENILEEQSCQISSQSHLKWRSRGLISKQDS